MLAPPWIPIPPGGYGGIEWVVHLLTEELVARGHDVSLFATGDSRSAATLHYVMKDAPTARMHETSLDAHHVGFAWQVIQAQIDAGMPPDVVHDHTAWLAAAFAPTLPMPVVHTHHGAFDDDNRRFYTAFMDHVTHTCISEHQRSTWPQLPVAAVVPNAIDVANYQWQTEKDDFLLCVSRVHPTKGNHLALAVGERLDLPVVLAGKIDPGEGREYFMEDIAPRLHGEKARFLGEVGEDEKRDLMKRARATVFPIQWDEPFGLVMIESMAAGTPCVAFNRGAAAEVIVDGVTGFLVDDLDGMVEAVKKVGEISPETCRKHVEQHFAPGVMADGYLEVYQSVLR